MGFWILFLSSLYLYLYGPKVAKLLMKIRYYLALIALFFLNQSLALEGELVLNGTSMYSEYGKSYYIGGLYLRERNSDLDAILSPESPKAMQIVVTKNEWGKLAWKRYWRDSIVINNPDVTKHQSATFEALAKFTSVALQIN